MPPRAVSTQSCELFVDSLAELFLAELLKGFLSDGFEVHGLMLNTGHAIGCISQHIVKFSLITTAPLTYVKVKHFFVGLYRIERTPLMLPPPRIGTSMRRSRSRSTPT